ncbi:DNA methyltransferase [Burkholderia pseudomultivorans]|uniref:Methyltransferase n=1 Tax=Burkholderia pseudomultivorans TaxID=1207504 RepID=A0A132EZV7_9BURK|nr:DNA methyltransferase [Burkholderia pseudomultivorans]KWF63259.1 hypothetical protein WT57_22830 [Burkholderia pseudomultivorans]
MTIVTSWLRLSDEAAESTLPADLRARDSFAARDCGWVEQMVPFIGSHATPGGWIVDPFCGFGTTLVAAARCGVPALGVEIDAQRVRFARERLARAGTTPARHPVLAGDLSRAATQAAARDAGGPFTLCLTSVPYFGCDERLGAADGQLYGIAHYATFLERMRDVFAGVHALLEPGGWCIAMAQNLRLGGRFVPLAWDVARLLGERFVLHEERVLVYERAGGPAPHGNGPTDRTHEYALVCRKAPLASDVDAARALLAALARDGFAFAVFGGFARQLAADATDATDATAPLNDVDLVVPPDDAGLSRLLQWLDADGFSIESWNSRITPPVAAAALRYRHYFRARRVDARGRLLQVDVTVAETHEGFAACAAANPA